MAEETDLDDVWVLCRDILEKGAQLELNDEMRALLSRTAQQVAIRQQDAEDALHDHATAMTLLREIHHRIGRGSNRLDEARDRVNELQQQGDFDRAQQVMRDVLAVEVVPFYRKQAEGILKKSAGLAEVLAFGRLNPSLPDRPQLAALAERLQQGHPLELTDDLRDLLRRTAPTAAITETETEEFLMSPEGVEALMKMILSRFRNAKRRFLRAMFQMTSLRDAGDIQGARQQMRDVLAVEVVPRYRQAAEEQLRSLDRLLPKP
jgi:DUSAM domain-containing protein